MKWIKDKFVGIVFFKIIAYSRQVLWIEVRILVVVEEWNWPQLLSRLSLQSM